ncbi:ParB-like protein [Variovorax terrae]|uniref:Chromosome partitioning protein ParB n=1 Tax=Variovorax terrae TaxID=2923278 RepID=A0A9X1VTX3_9BURK|nr:ParB-like protein [Variovorax terrae]MCJ0761807.1 chromosome partitioning protein ParB [Variovorax terrae]
MHTRHQHLFKTDLRRLRPTQITVGYAEVEQKRGLWSGMGKAERQKFLDSHWFPAVRGPGDNFYIVDHHHLGRALLEEGVDQSFVVLLKDLSMLGKDEFWTVMDHHQWVHPYDAKGRRRTVADLPKALDKLTDDPYRSLAGEVRHAGGFPKDATPFAEFLWADFFRRRIKTAQIQRDPDTALQKAMTLCHSTEAAHLPGWSGEAAPLAS